MPVGLAEMEGRALGLSLGAWDGCREGFADGEKLIDG